MKNSNSNKKCHGYGCNEPKPDKIVKQEQIRFQRNNVRDYCPVCKMHTNFIRIKGKNWSCTRCHKTFKMIGKPIPELKKGVVIVGQTTPVKEHPSMG